MTRLQTQQLLALVALVFAILSPFVPFPYLLPIAVALLAIIWLVAYFK